MSDREASTGKPDLKMESRERRSENDKKLFVEPDHRSGINGTVAKPPVVPGEDSDREDFSVNQSNSTGSKSGNRKSTAENDKSETKPEFAGSYRPEQNRRAVEPADPQSDDGSTDTVAKNSTCDISETKKKETQRVDDSSELADSEAQSNGGETATRESSEVQSSASLTGRMKRKRLLKKEISGGSSGNEPRRTPAVKSRPFDEVLQMIRAHKHSSLFESRLQSQETEEYKGMVRQHLDLETVQAKINSGSYSSSTHAFYRDLLLLFNNVVTFFPKSSRESVAARELRLLVSIEMKKALQVAQIDPSPEVVDSSPTIPSRSKGPDLEGSQSLLAKQKSSVPIIVCRKRSKISSKLSSTTGLGEKGERSNDDEKIAVDLKSSIKIASTNPVEDQGTTKDSKVKEKPITGARSMRRSNDSATNSSGPTIKKQNTNSGWKPSSGNETETQIPIPIPDKKKSDTVTLEKKRSAADFLKRIKQNSPAETTTKRNSRGGSSSSLNAEYMGGTSLLSGCEEEHRRDTEMAPKTPRVTRNPDLIRGVGKYSRSKMYHKRGLWAIKAKNGGVFPRHDVKLKADAPAEKSPKFYPADDVKKPLVNKRKARLTKLRASITPGTVLIILAGRFKGKRVVFLKQLPSGLLLVTGPFKINGVPLRRVNQSYAIATSTKVDISGVNAEKFDDKYFSKEVQKKKKKGEGEFFEAEKEEKSALPADRKDDQKAVDTPLIKSIEGVPELKAYLAARFSLKAGMKPHELVF
ncbi:uncharacterized protein LOC111806995 isoform X2 [Cucurbita pepo subsp. pepo]|nr:uncharacterized protein LOC111806995 isoform X2 [Cucurbita pepo subsp. pepo]